MFTGRYDVFEDENEINRMVNKLQSESVIHMRKLDAWDIQSHSEALKSAENMARKVVAGL